MTASNSMRRRSAFEAVSVLWLATALLLSMPAAGQDDPHAKHRAMTQQAEKPSGKGADVHIPSADLTTHRGETVDLSADVVGDNIVVMDFVYTTCTTICPVLSAIMSQVQQQLGERAGTEVTLVSITVDPQRDTPARLASYADKMKAGDGWVWLTGEKTTVDDVLKSLGVYTPNFEDHPSMILVGDGANGRWSRYVGFPGASQIVKKINELSAARDAQAALRE